MSAKNNIDIIISATDNASNVLKQTQKELSDFSSSSVSLWKVWEENKWKITAAAWIAFAWMSYYLKKGIDDVNEYNYSIKRLETLTKNSTGATDSQVRALVKQAESLEKVWVATKDNIVASMSQFATFDMSTKAIGKLTNAFVDYVVAEKWASASSEEYRMMANGLAQALNGNYASLSRTWFILDEETKALIANWTEMEKVNAIVKVLNTTYRDFNKTAWETAEWKMILLQRSLNDIRETIAASLLPIFERVISVISDVVSSLAEWVSEHPQLAPWIALVWTALAWLLTVIWSFSLMLPAISTAIWLLSWPIWIVIWVLSALWAAYLSNFWWFRDFVNEVWSELSPVVSEIAASFSECFQKIWSVIKEVYQKLEPILAPFWEVFWEVVKVSLEAVVEIISMSFKVIWDVVSSWLTIFSEFLSFLINVFQWNCGEAFNNLVTIVDELWKATVSIFEDLWIDLPQIFENLKSVITWIWSSTFSWLKEICSWALDWISNKISWIWDSIQSARDAISSLWSDSSSVNAVWSRASWWVVLAWQTYRVNEIHGEYFRPSTNGTISVNPQNWSPNVSISFWDVILNNWDDANQFSERVRNVMIEVFRNKALWCY